MDCIVYMQTSERPFVAIVFSPGIAPHCLDPGTVRSVTVEKFCGEKWEESMQAHKTIRDMSWPSTKTAESNQITPLWFKNQVFF